MTNQRDVLLRIFHLHKALAEGSYPSLQELAEEAGVSQRQVQRDIDSLKAHGADIRFARSKNGYYYKEPFSLMPCAFTPNEMHALLLSLEVSDTRTIISVKRFLSDAVSKIRRMQPEVVGPCVVADNNGGLGVEIVVNYFDLAKAVENGQQVRLTYRSVSRDEQTERVVDPYFLRCHKGIFYLVGYCHLRAEKRIFALHRIRGLKLLTEQFERPDLEAEMRENDQRFGIYADEGLYDVVVEFEPLTARRMRERVWHPSQQIETLPDGGIRLSMTVQGLTEVVHWVLGYGSFCRPVAPVELVQRVRQHVQKMAESMNLPEGTG